MPAQIISAARFSIDIYYHHKSASIAECSCCLLSLCNCEGAGFFGRFEQPQSKTERDGRLPVITRSALRGRLSLRRVQCRFVAAVATAARAMTRSPAAGGRQARRRRRQRHAQWRPRQGQVTGGTGDNSFVFADPEKPDKVTDFDAGDGIGLVKGAFPKIGLLGELKAKHCPRRGLRRDQGAEDSLRRRDRLASYAKNGVKTADPVEFARIGKHLDLDRSDILVV